MHRIAVMVVLALLAGGQLSAQSSQAQSSQTQANPPRMATPPLEILATGCLKRGPDGGYYLGDRNGNTWELSSTKVNLAEQVMHVVTVTGRPGEFAQSPASGNQQGSKPESRNNSARPLQVLTLKMLSNSCTR